MVTTVKWCFPYTWQQTVMYFRLYNNEITHTLIGTQKLANETMATGFWFDDYVYDS